jgi:hypothetical protein
LLGVEPASRAISNLMSTAKAATARMEFCLDEQRGSRQFALCRAGEAFARQSLQ